MERAGVGVLRGWVVDVMTRRKPPREAPARAGLREADDLLADALGRGIVDAATHARLQALLEMRRRLARAAAGPPPVTPVPPMPGLTPKSVPSATTGVAASPPVAPTTPSPAAAPPRPAEPTRPAHPIRDLVVSDLAVHGLTYLGALLLFAGALGFVLFSFGSVQRALRPLAEIAAPTVLLLSARFLRRRGAPFVATALGLLGGVLLPPFVFASLVDGVAFPPDLSGGPLIVALVAVSLAVAFGYAWYARRDPRASVRFLVAPAIWLAVWAAALVTAELPAGGYSLRHWSAAQLAFVSLAVAATAVAVHARPRAPLAASTTRAIAPGIAIAYLLTIALAGTEGWPWVPIVGAGVAALVVLETVFVPPQVVQILQPLVVGGSVVALAPELGIGLAGAVGAVAFVALLERHDRRRPGPIGLTAAGIGLAASLVASVMDPWTTTVAFGGASIWAHVRRLAPMRTAAAAAALRLAAAGLPVGAAVGLVVAVSPDVAVITGGLVAAGAASVTRRWRRHDTFLGWWAAAAAAAVTVGSASPAVEPAAAAFAAALGALALRVAAVPRSVAGPAWPAAMAWSLWSVLIAIGVGPEGRATGLAAFACLVLVISCLDRSWSIDVGGGAVGLVLAGASVSLHAMGWARIGVLTAWVVAMVASTWGETRGTGPIALLARRADRSHPRWGAAIRLAPVVGGALAMPFLAARLGELTGITGGRRSWSGVAVAAVGVVEALVARGVLLAGAGRPPISGAAARVTATATAAFVTTIVGISVAAPDPWPTIDALVALVVATFVLGRALRRRAMIWTAWAASAALTVLLVERAGVAPRDLWVAMFVWGSLTLVGGLALDDLREGRRAAGETIRVGWLRPPVLLGALALPVSLAFAFRGAPGWYAGWSIVAAALYLIVAVQLRAGAIVAIAASLATVGGAVLSPVPPIEEPLLFVPWVGALAGVAIIVGPGSGTRDHWDRWDLGLIVAGHGVAAVALARALAVDELVPTWAAFGGLSLIAAALVRRVAWGVAGAVLLVVAAWAAGPGWLSLALAVAAMISGVAAGGSRGIRRWGLQASSAVLAAGAWERFLAWSTWAPPRAVIVTALVAGGLSVSAAAAVRLGWLARDWAVTLGALGITWSAVAAIAARLPTADLSASAAGLVAAAGGGALALALGTSAPALGLFGQREGSALVGVLTALQVGAALGTSRAAGAGFAATAGLLAVVAWIGLRRARPASRWLRPVGLVAAAADLVSLLLALSVLPQRRDVLEAALVLTGVECAVAGLALRLPRLVTLAPGFVLLAWLVYASEAFRGEVQWFTVPAGIAILAGSSIERRARRIVGSSPNSPEVLLAEFVGMVLVVAVASVETITIGPIRGPIAILGGASLAAWGVLTRVRRRVWFGSAAATLGVALMVVGPIARLVPEFRGPALWGLLIAVGVTMIVAATLLERGRAKIGALVRRLDRLMEGWE